MKYNVVNDYVLTRRNCISMVCARKTKLPCDSSGVTSFLHYHSDYLHSQFVRGRHQSLINNGVRGRADTGFIDLHLTTSLVCWVQFPQTDLLPTEPLSLWTFHLVIKLRLNVCINPNISLGSSLKKTVSRFNIQLVFPCMEILITLYIDKTLRWATVFIYCKSSLIDRWNIFDVCQFLIK